MAEVIDNPAGRLHKVLAFAFLQSNGTPFYTAAGRGFGIPDPINPVVVSYEILRLIDEIKAQIEITDSFNRELATRPIMVIEKQIIDINSATPVHQVKSIIDATVLLGLEHFSDHLSRHAAEMVISEEGRTGLIAETEKLISLIERDVSDLNLKRLLLNYLFEFQHALNLYRARGTKGLTQAIDQVIGGLMLHREELNNILEESSKVTVFPALYDFLQKVAVVVGFAANIKALISPVGAHFLALPPH